MALMNDQASEEERHDEIPRPLSRPPCFYKTVSDYCVEGGPSCWMQVPPAFVRNFLPHVDRMSTVLQNAEGATWPVEYMAEHGFVTGWAGFATGNALEIGDTLVFSFVEEAKFVVQVFGKSGCEKGTQQRDLSPPPSRPVRGAKLRPDLSHSGKDRLSPGHSQPGREAKICKVQKGSAPSRYQAVNSNVLRALKKLRANPAWGNSLSQKYARTMVIKAKLRKLTHTPPKPLAPNQQQRKKRKRSFGEGGEGDGEIGFDAASGYHGDRGGRSSLGSPPFGDAEAEADLRAFAEYGMHGNRRLHEDVPPRKPGRPRKYAHVLPQDSGDAGAVVTEKRKRGRPFKYQAPGSSDLTLRPLREIYVSRRRKVTQAERELALNSAYTLASQLRASTTFIVVMRQSFVYRNFVLCVPRRFANRYMPDTNRQVTLVDSAWNAWFCAWNAAYKYISGRGWRNFALEHCLEEDDALLMEILEDHAHKLTIKVHMFPVVPVPEGLTGWQSHVCPPNSHFEPNSGIPIDPILRPVGKIRPRLQRKRKSRVKRERVYSEGDEFTTSSDSSEELD